jgi:hypothetical protein
MKTQLERLGKLLQRKRGATSVDICEALPSVCPHKRLADLKQRGWTITKKRGEKLITYFGRPPEIG